MDLGCRCMKGSSMRRLLVRERACPPEPTTDYRTPVLKILKKSNFLIFSPNRLKLSLMVLNTPYLVIIPLNLGNVSIANLIHGVILMT